MTAAGPRLPRSDRTEMGPLTGEHRLRIRAPWRWSARPSLTHLGRPRCIAAVETPLICAGARSAPGPTANMSGIATRSVGVGLATFQRASDQAHVKLRRTYFVDKRHGLVVRADAAARQHATPVARCLPIGRALISARRESSDGGRSLDRANRSRATRIADSRGHSRKNCGDVLSRNTRRKNLQGVCADRHGCPRTVNIGHNAGMN